MDANLSSPVSGVGSAVYAGELTESENEPTSSDEDDDLDSSDDSDDGSPSVGRNVEVETGISGITESNRGRALKIQGGLFNGVEGAEQILSTLKPAHDEIRISTSCALLRKEGFRCLLDGLRSRSRSATGEWANFSLDAVAITISGNTIDFDAGSEYDAYVSNSHWCLSLIMETFFQDPSDFADLTSIEIGAFWSPTHAKNVQRIMSDKRLSHIRLDQSEGHLSVVEHQLRSLLDRIKEQPYSIAQVGVIKANNSTGPAGPSPARLAILEDLVLDVVGTGTRGLTGLWVLDSRLFSQAGRLPELVKEANANELINMLLVCAQEDDDVARLKGICPDGVEDHLSFNFCRYQVVATPLLSIVVPARVLLHARSATPPSLTPHPSTTSPVDRHSSSTSHVDRHDRRTTILSLPPDILDHILHQLANIVADDASDQFEDEYLLWFPHLLDLTEQGTPFHDVPDSAAIWDMILYASDMSTVHRERRKDWTERLLWERRRAWMTRKLDQAEEDDPAID